MLDYFAGEVEAGRDIVPNLQRAVNAVLASALATGKLPKRRIGRPVARYELDRQRRIAAAVLALRAQGIGMSEAVEQVVQHEHRDVRTVYGHVRLHKNWVDRQAQKDRMLADFRAGAAPILQALFVNQSDSDYRRAVAKEILRLFGDDLPLFRRARKLVDLD